MNKLFKLFDIFVQKLLILPACWIVYFHSLRADYLSTNSLSVISGIYVTIEVISYNTTLSERCASWSFCTAVWLCGCKQSSFVAVRADNFDIRFCGMTVLKFLWTCFRMYSEIISCFFWRTRNICFPPTEEPDFWNLFTSFYGDMLLIMKDLTHWETDL